MSWVCMSRLTDGYTQADAGSTIVWRVGWSPINMPKRGVKRTNSGARVPKKVGLSKQVVKHFTWDI